MLIVSHEAKPPRPEERTWTRETKESRAWERVCSSKIPRQAASEGSGRGMGTVRGSLASSQPPWHLALPPLPLLAFYLISSPLVSPLSPAFTHVCLRKGRSPWRAPRLFRASIACPVYICAHSRAPAFRARMCALAKKTRGEDGASWVGWELLRRGHNAPEHDRLSFRKMSRRNNAPIR